MKQILFIIAATILCSNAYSQKISQKKELKFQELVQKGDSLVEAGKVKESIPVFTEAIKVKPVQPEGYYRRAMARFADSDFYSAVSDFTKVIVLNSNNAEAYFMRGLCKLQIREVEADACADLKKAKELKYEVDWAMFKDICKDL